MSDLPGGDCNVCIYFGNGDEGPDNGFLVTTVPRSRKKYCCCECRDVIPAGTKYEKTFGKWEGDLLTFRTCLPCAEIRKALCCEGWTYTCLWEDAGESIFGRLTTGCLQKLTTAAAKEKLLEKWREWKF